MMKRLMFVWLGFILFLVAKEGIGQELKVDWGERANLKKLRGYVYNFSGTTNSSIIVTHQSTKKGIVISFFDKGNLNLTKSVATNDKFITVKGEKTQLLLYNSYLYQGNIYVFAQVKLQSNEFYLYGKIYSENGEGLGEWQQLGTPSNYYAFNINGGGYYLKRELALVTLNRGKGYFIFRNNIDQVMFYDLNLDVIYHKDGVTDKIYTSVGKVTVSESGKTWIIGKGNLTNNTNTGLLCEQVIGVDVVNNTVVMNYNKCVPVGQPDNEINYETIKAPQKYDVVGDRYFMFYGLFMKKGNYAGIFVKKYDLVDDTLVLDDEYLFTTSEVQRFNDKGLGDVDINSEKFNKKDEIKIKYNFFWPQHIKPESDKLNFAGECKLSQIGVEKKISHDKKTGAMKIKYVNIRRFQYKDIFTFKLDTSGKLLWGYWLPKNQVTLGSGEGEEMMSFIPYETRYKMYYIYVGHENTFKGENDKPFTAYDSEKAFLGYSSVSTYGKIEKGTLVNLKKQVKDIPQIQTYYLDGKDLYLFAVRSKKVRLIRISPN